MTRSLDDFNTVQRLIAKGLTDYGIFRLTGIPRSTVHDWRHRPPPSLARHGAASPCGTLHEFSDLPAHAYAYLLGLYLGDGCIARDRRSWRLRIACDTRYPIGLFTGALDALDIPWRRSNAHTVSIYRKAATARLDEFIGPKDRAVPLTRVHYTA